MNRDVVEAVARQGDVGGPLRPSLRRVGVMETARPGCGLGGRGDNAARVAVVRMSVRAFI